MHQPVLIALQDNITPLIYPVETEVSMLGRYETCQVMVPGNVISRIHATIERSGPYCYLQDARSANGTYVNHQRIHEKYLLKDQDVIGLGPGEPHLRFEDAEAAASVLPRLRYDEQNVQFYLNDTPLQLIPNELRLLRYLYQHLGDLCNREGCAEAVWERAYDPGPDDEGLDRLVVGLRQKLGEICPEARHSLVTRRDLGYLLAL